MNKGARRGLAKTATVDIPADGWVPLRHRLEFSSSVKAATATSVGCFVLNSRTDLTRKLQANSRLKLTHNGIVKVFIVTVISSTQVTVISPIGQADLTALPLTSIHYSHVNAPFAFPTNPLLWSVILTSASDGSQAAPVQNTVYNLGSFSLTLPPGTWTPFGRVCLSGAGDTTADPDLVVVQGCVNDVNNSFTGALCQIQVSVSADGPTAAFGVAASNTAILTDNVETVAALTTYYMLARATTANVADLRFDCDQSPLFFAFTTVHL